MTIDIERVRPRDWTVRRWVHEEAFERGWWEPLALIHRRTGGIFVVHPARETLAEWMYDEPIGEFNSLAEAVKAAEGRR